MANSKSADGSGHGKTLTFLFSASVFLLLLHSALRFEPVIFSLMLLSLLGAFVCVLVILYTMRKDTPLLRRLCKTSGRFDCNSVLDSGGSRLYKNITLGDAGLIYFSCQFLFMLFGDADSQLLPDLLLLSLPAFLAWCFTFRSLWYQWRVIKRW
ncbi:MAG TPA: vitamin K epoxide reductase family protein [Puia sp.]|nr:vitamin K epoxide reductase family protein [Puia sp.]